MERILLSLTILFFCFSTSAQFFMDLKGNKVLGKSINEVNAALGIKKTTVFLPDNSSDMIGFKKLSNQPIWAYAKNAADIPMLVKKYDYQKYLDSYSFKMDVEEMIKDSSLNKAYALEVFGKPDLVQLDKAEVFDEWLYRKYNLKLMFDDSSVAIEAKFINYAKLSKHQLSITQYNVTSDDYSGGFSISVNNLSSKTIKYIWITTIAYNPVDDVIGTKTVKGVGPVASKISGSWSFESVYYSKVFDRLKITAIKIQYTDGSTRLIPSADISKIFFEDE